jgi:hypothetical protein
MNKKEQSRLAALLPRKNNLRTPRYVRCYDNGGKTADRYTIVFTGRYLRLTGGEYFYVGANGNPHHPAHGFYQHGSSRTQIDVPSYRHLGKKITFSSLPKEVQDCIVEDYCDLWSIKLE